MSLQSGSKERASIDFSQNYVKYEEFKHKQEAKRRSKQVERESARQSSSVTKVSGDTKYILYYYGRVEGWFPHGHYDFSECPVSDCVQTTNSTLLGSHGNFDAVVVGNPLYSILWNGTRYSKMGNFFKGFTTCNMYHVSEHRLIIPDQSERRPHQRYIFYQRNSSPYQYSVKDAKHLQMAIEEVKSKFMPITPLQFCMLIKYYLGKKYTYDI